MKKNELGNYLERQARYVFDRLKLERLALYEVKNQKIDRLFCIDLNSPALRSRFVNEVILNQIKIEHPPQFFLPVKFQDQLLGVLEVYLNKEAPLQASGLSSEVIDLAAQFSCLLKQEDRRKALLIDQAVTSLQNERPEYHNWVGIYLINKNGLLELTSFRGENTPHLVIPLSTGICGAAVRERKTLNIADVNADPRYLSCSIKTKSEIVVPLFQGEQVIGEIDIDSHFLNAFSPADEKTIGSYAESLSKSLK